MDNIHVNAIVLRDTYWCFCFLYVALTKKEKKVKIMNFALTNFSAALIGTTVGYKSKNAVICQCQQLSIYDVQQLYTRFSQL